MSSEEYGNGPGYRKEAAPTDNGENSPTRLESDDRLNSSQMQRGNPKLRALIQKSKHQADALTLADIEDCFDFAMDGFQKDAIVAFLKNQNVVVSAPTGR